MTAPRLLGLDLLRGIAIGLVLLRHALPDLLPGAGVVGVVMFFALSGHLITGLLVSEQERTGRLDLRRFYWRRMTRLVPALVTVLAVVVAVTLAVDPLEDRSELPRTVLVALTWTANLPFDQGSDAIFHLWTLATEEQFYLLWPALLGLALARGWTGRVLLVAAGGCLLACVATLAWLWEDPDLAYALPTSWAVCFVVGAASRVYVDRSPVPPPWLVGVALAVLGVLSVVPLRGHHLTYLAGGPVIAAATVILIAAWRSAPPTGRWLAPMVWLGTVSYGAYLWNYPLTLWFREWFGTNAGVGVAAAALTVTLAAATWHWVEAPALRRRDREPVTTR